MSEGMLDNPIKFGEIRRNRLRERRRNVKSQDGGRAADRKQPVTSFPPFVCRAHNGTSIPNFVNFDQPIREKRAKV